MIFTLYPKLEAYQLTAVSVKKPANKQIELFKGNN